MRNILTKAIEKLPGKERKVVLLYYYNELTMKEISMNFVQESGGSVSIPVSATKKKQKGLQDPAGLF